MARSEMASVSRGPCSTSMRMAPWLALYSATNSLVAAANGAGMSTRTTVG